MPIHKKKIRPLARLHGYWIYRRFLSRTEAWPVARRRAYVLDRLRTTLIQANQGVPFYRERFRQAGFDPEKHFRSPADLEVVPLLTKDEVRANFERLVDRRFLGGSVVAHTSGTTGQPMVMRLSEYYVAFDYACMFRHWAQAGYRFWAPYAAIRSYVPGTPSEPLWRYNLWQNTLYMSAYHLKPSNAQAYLEALLRFRPHYLRGYASSLNVLAEYAAPQRERFGFVRGVFTASEMLLESERATIERVFGKRLYDWYGMTEPAVVITERSDHDGLEVNWEYGYPEFMPANGLAGGEYRLVTTSLHNPVMPFIRYDTEDLVRLAEPSGEPDRIYPKVRSIVGRKDECLLTADGGRLPSLNFYSLLQDYEAILRFQFIQPELNRLVVKLSLRPAVGGVEGMLARLEGELRRRIGPDFALKIEITDQFVRNEDGKTPTFVRTVAGTNPGNGPGGNPGVGT